MSAFCKARVIFVVGTDTGAGKTVLTGLLLQHLRARGVNALALKPFCAGGREDVQFLQGIQDRALTDEEVNPWYFPAPVAPAVSFAKNRRKLNKTAVISHIRRMAKKADVLLVEGAGGLLSPLGANLSALDLIRNLRPEVILAARNRLGCLNHIFLTAFALQKAGVKRFKVVLLGISRPDSSVSSNAAFLRKKGNFIGVFAIPYLGRNAARAGAVKKNEKKVKKTLARILHCDIYPALFGMHGDQPSEPRKQISKKFVDR